MEGALRLLAAPGGQVGRGSEQAHD
jgi:hypothetical protein